MLEPIATKNRPKIFDDLEKIAPIIPAPFYWLNTQRVIVGANKALLNSVGVGPESFIGRTPDEIYPKSFADHIKAKEDLVLTDGITIADEDEAINITSGEARWFTTVRAPLHDEDGTIIGIIGTAIDITAQKEAELLRSEKLEEQEKVMKTVLQVVHDIRSPLMIIDILSGETSHFPEDQRVLLRNATQRINDITSNLLHTYKSSQQSSTIQELPLFVFLSRLFSEKQLQYAKHNIQFKLEIADSAYFAFTLFGLSDLQRILSNLFNNAVEAIVSKGVITISLKVQASSIQLSIKDNGKGIPASVLDKLGQAGNSYDKSAGTGLGLSHAMETVKKYQGELQINSE
jgi:PAS domain S-box-containing protein